MEAYYLYVLIAGAAIFAAGCLWLVVAAFRTHVGWGLATALLPRLGGLMFLSGRPDRAKRPFALLLLGAVVVAGTFAVNRVASRYVDFGLRDKIVDGERHVTLTGWKDGNYADI